MLVVKVPLVAHATDGPDFCGSCHVMESEVDSYLHASHREVASCGDCHIPHDIITGSYYKAYTGVKDAAFVMMGKTEHVEAGDLAKQIIQNNCLSCHSDLMSMVGDTKDEYGRYCFDCHTTVRHTK